MAMHKDDLIIDIDDQVEVLLQQINSAPNQRQQRDFVESFQNMLIDQVLGPFGLSRALFDDRDGGAITSMHNFEKGVVANDSDGARHAQWTRANDSNFERTDYDAQLDKRFPDMKSPDGKYHDGYRKPGTELPEGPRTAARDHLVPASEVERSSRGHLAQTREERVQTATQDQNVVLTSFSMNSSKGDEDLLVWAQRPNSKDPSKTNAETYDLDDRVLKEKHREAKAAVEGAQKKAVLMKQGGELLVEGGKAAGYLALRQALGMILKDVVQGLIDDVRYLVREGFNGARSLLEMVQDRLQATFRSLREKWAEYLKEGASAGLSGFFSTLITLVINSFITTAKNIVTLIREAVLALARSIKVIVAPPADMTKGEIAFEVLRLLSAALATCVGLALEETIKKALESIALLAPVAGELAPIIAGIITGSLTLFTVLAFDRIKDAIAFRNKQLADVHRGQSIGLLKIKQTVLMLDSANKNMTMTAQTLRIQFEESWIGVQESREETQRSIASYQSSVRALDNLLEQF
ncbi:hypothetical protein EF096_10745 [Pseudomonas neustonica]|uniref:Uncharacterized protein n=1 Tax=Pseudomonas neustonica TaxID=2487346 RepID=A0ABX9XHT3_9PSED|nr:MULTISPECIES: hypothetical protein [Pseudomonas]ROZ84216.1 hypothetical protein EF099_07840 [Pseudomonas sp. SSM44]ROZ84463.1 hypothetical protein EF096_10745 [Pseudomonas neustonica]